MQYIATGRLIVILAVSLTTGSLAKAQEFKTNVSIREQLINGTVENARYGPQTITSVKKAGALNSNEGKQSLSQQIKNGTFNSMKSAGGGSGVRSLRSNVQPVRMAAPGALASEGKPDLKKEPIMTPPVLPTQGKEPVAEQIIGPRRKAILPAQGENAKEPVKN